MINNHKHPYYHHEGFVRQLLRLSISMAKTACKSLSLCIVALLFICLTSVAHAEKRPLEMQSEDERLIRWQLTADSVEDFTDLGITEAKGNFILRHGKEYLKADFARYYSATNWVYLQGNVEVSSGEDVVRAESAEFDLRSRTGWLKKGKIFLSGPHTYVSGDHIEKHWGDVYTFKEATLTTCDGEVPAWSIKTDEATLEIDGYAHLKGSTFQVKDSPIAYTPFMMFPVKTKRQTGLLTPEFGRSSVKGGYFNLPFFWAINDNSDMTLNVEIMEKRGVKPGIEYRSTPSSTSTAWLRFDWMNDSETKKSYGTNRFGGDGYLRTNHDRWWLRGMYDNKVEGTGWHFKSDIDLVSDQYFLSEMKSNLSGYRRSRNELFSLFGRDLVEKSDKRESGFLLSHDWQRGSANISARYTQDQYLGHGNLLHKHDTTLQRLPQFDAFLYKGRILPNIPLEADASVQAAYMYRRSGTKGARYVIKPRLTMPLSSRYGSIIASGGIVEKLYNTNSASYTPNMDVPSVNRPYSERLRGSRQADNETTVPFFNIAATTDFARVYSLDKPALQALPELAGTSQWTGLRHSFQPKLEYIYNADVNQRDTPYYDEKDRITPRTDIVYSLTNVLTRKKEAVHLQTDKDGNSTPIINTDYAEFIRFRLEQSYDHREATRTDMQHRFKRRPFGDIKAELDVRATDSITLSTKNDWSPYENMLTRHQSGASYKYNDYASFYVGYDHRNKIEEYKRYRPDNLRYLTTRADLSWQNLALGTSFSYDMEDAQNHETDITLSYKQQCYTITGGVLIDAIEESYHLNVILFGLGD